MILSLVLGTLGDLTSKYYFHFIFASPPYPATLGQVLLFPEHLLTCDHVGLSSRVAFLYQILFET